MTSELSMFPLLDEGWMRKRHVWHDQICSTVHVKHSASHVVGGVAGQEEHSVCDILDLSEAEEGNRVGEGCLLKRISLFVDSFFGSLFVVGNARVA